ncbi:hypothetical protein HJC23_008155 [Cyclotella cryptica]|uniref:Uncharacterized protein n=1 Tax=Cyclotella cryptica TaxID=29204 RepID=A0ABD3PJ55_9STRA
MGVVQLVGYWCPVGALNLRGVAGGAVNLICSMKWECSNLRGVAGDDVDSICGMKWELCSFWCTDGALNLRGVAGDAVDSICGMKWEVRPRFISQ